MIDRRRGTVRPAELWRQRLIRSLLYGRNVDRAVKARVRVGFAIVIFAAIYAVIGGRLIMFAVGGDNHGARRTAAQAAIATARPDSVDRNGEVLATDVKAPSLFGEPRRIIDKDEAIELLTAALPDLDTGEVRDRLSSKKGFVWLKREITPLQQQEIHRLGIPGIGFLRENKRVYPTGNEVAHLIGLVTIDNQGIAGMEKWLDNNGLADLHRAGFATDRLQRPVELSVDLRVEHALRDELLKAKEKYKAKAASGLVCNVKTGEIVAMVSLPDFDPNNPREAHDPDRINRLTTGVYEMGSTFKALTLAMALDSGKANLGTMFDARGALHYGKFAIHDTHPLGRTISLQEVFKSETSEKMRYLMRLKAEIGTARQAEVKGYYIGGKTGTSEKVVNGRYSKKQVLNSFTAIVPADNPQFQVLVMLDEPKPLPETHGFITSGWNAVPTGGKVIARIAPLLGLEPRFDLPPSDRLILAASRSTQ